MHAVVSVDGFIADAEDNVGPLFEWYFNGDAEIVDGGPFKVSRDSVRYVRPVWHTPDVVTPLFRPPARAVTTYARGIAS